MSIEDRDKLDDAWHSVYDWERWANGYGPDSAGDTIAAFNLMGRLALLSQIADGAPVHELIERALEEAEEMTAKPEDEEEDE